MYILATIATTHITDNQEAITYNSNSFTPRPLKVTFPIIAVGAKPIGNIVIANLTNKYTVSTFSVGDAIDIIEYDEVNSNIYYRFIGIIKAITFSTTQCEIIFTDYIADLKLPRVSIYADFCQHTYGRDSSGNQTGTCPYTTKTYYNTAAVSVSNANEDACSRRFSTGCRVRFTGLIPFLGSRAVGGARSL